MTPASHSSNGGMADGSWAGDGDAAIEARMKILDDVASRYNEDGTPKGQASQSSAVAATPMKFDPKYPVKYEKGTGRPFHFINGKYVPIDGVVPPQAGGVPKRNP